MTLIDMEVFEGVVININECAEHGVTLEDACCTASVVIGWYEVPDEAEE